ncbi:MAG: helix-turn-helix transcriptional regulator [Clostridia bacterium]|nr:helix-turn-helix transcriptional regulator [Clostridia bacterium]
MKFTKRFNELLQNCGKSQVEIAKAIHVSKQCVNDYKTGKSVPSIETLFLLCRVLDVSADYLLGLSDDY